MEEILKVVPVEAGLTIARISERSDLVINEDGAARTVTAITLSCKCLAAFGSIAPAEFQLGVYVSHACIQK